MARLILTFIQLLMLLAISIAATLWSEGVLQWAINLSAAIGMAGLILGVFMGLGTASNLVRLFALGGWLWLAFLLLLTLMEVLSRGL